MPKAQRLESLKKLSDRRGGSLVITYVTSTRNGFEVPIEIDAVRRFYNHISLNKANKKNSKIDLLIHSNGGNGIVPWRLVTLLREHCKHFAVLIPHRAFSAATLIALGADEIIMHPMGMLGPVDPTVANPFNPEDPRNPQQKIGISVEDVSAFIALIKEDVGIHHEDELVQAINILANKVHPLALGNVKRSMSQSRMMAKKLLELHMKKAVDEHKIDEIVENLTSKLYFHGHPINREEAIGLGLKIAKSDEETERLLWELYMQYEEEMMLETPFRPLDDFINANATLQPNQTATLRLPTSKGVYIESTARADIFTADFDIIGTRQPNGTYSIIPAPLRQGWQTE